MTEAPGGSGRPVATSAIAPVADRSLPLLLPSATLTAFLLLIVAVLAFTVVEHPGVYGLLTGHSGGRIGPGNACMRRAIAAAGGTDAAVRLWTTGQHVPGAAGCAGDNARGDQSAGYLLAVLVVLLATGLQYWFASTRRARRDGVLPVTAGRFPELYGELTRLAGQAVPATRVRFLIDLLDPSAGGVAFGRVNRRHVLLGRGVIALMRDDPPAMRALVLHELAHLRNRDVDLTIITLAFVRAFVPLVLLPGVLAALLPLVLGVQWRLELAVLAQSAGVAVLLMLARGAVLRNREYQADARAAQVQTTAGPLRRILAANTAHAAEPGTRTGLRRQLRALGYVHPTPASRITALTDPAPLLYPAFGFAFVLGACLVLTWDPSDSPTGQLSAGWVFELWRPEPFTVVLAALLVLSALRAALYARATRRPVRLTSLRWGLALGVVAGTYLAPSAIVTPMLLPGVPAGVPVTSALILGGMAWLLVMWLELLAASWVGSVLPGRRRWLAAIPIAAVTAVVLGCARPLLHAELDYLFAVHDASSPLRALPRPLLVLTEANTVAVNAYLSHAGWLACGMALLAVPLIAGRLLDRRIAALPPGPWPAVAAPGSRPTAPMVARRTSWVAVGAAGAAFAAVLASIDWYVPLTSGAPAALLGPGPLLAASCAAVSAAVASAVRWHPVLLGVTASTVFGVGQAWLVSIDILGFGGALYCLGYGLETALAAALLVRALAYRPARCTRRRHHDGRAPWAGQCRVLRAGRRRSDGAAQAHPPGTGR